jgi:Arc/MetJ-type ribon-helix-helix transcriptional regulator
MHGSLRPDNEQFIESAVRNGDYSDRDEALNNAVDLLRRRDELIRDVNKGIDQLKRGQGTTISSDEELRRFMDHIKARGRQRLANESNT